MCARTILIALLFSLAHVPQLNAQFKDSRFGVGLLLGGSKLKGDIENTNTGFTGGVILRYAPISYFGISFSSTYGKMTSGLNAINTGMFNNTLFGTFFMLPSSSFNPFLTFGASRFHYSAKDGNNQLLSRADGTPFTGWGKALQFGFGFELITGQHWALNTMGNYNYTRNDELDGIVDGQSDGFFNGSIGLIHYFKKKPKIEDEDKYVKSSKNLEINEVISRQPQKETTPRENGTQGTSTIADLFAQGIHFAPNTAKILEKSKFQLYKIYKYMLVHPEEEIVLLAEDSTSASNDFTNRLVVARAKSIKIYLVNFGIKPSRIIVDSK